MALSLITNRQDPNKIEALEIDVTLREVHEYTNVISRNKTESGTDISDHVQQGPVKIILEGITSNTPVQFFSGNVSRFLRGDNTNRAQFAFNTLLQYAGYLPPKQIGDVAQRVTDPQPVTVVTALRIYDNMMITRLSFPRERTTGEALNYNVELQNLRKVTSQFAFIDNTSELNGAAPNVGNQAPKTVNVGRDTAKPASSTLLQIGRALVRKTKGL